MKKVMFSIVAVMTVIFLTIGCNNKDDDPAVPASKKKYAWVSGYQDSTGYGLILFSADGGNNFVRQAQDLPALQGIDLEGIWAVDENTVWAVGSDNVILRTINGGVTWNQVPAPAGLSHIQLKSISIVDKTNIWISGESGMIYKSADNGTTWSTFDTNYFHSGLLQGIWAITPQKVYVAGSNGEISPRGFVAFTLNGGADWDSLSPADDYNKTEWIGVTASGNTIVVYGGQSHYMVSKDGGLTWSNDSIHVGGGGGGADINHLIMLDSQKWWAAMDMGHIVLTKDGGSTWIDQTTGQGGSFLLGIDAWDDQLAIAVGVLAGWPITGPILKTANAGNLWELKLTTKTHLSQVTFIKN